MVTINYYSISLSDSLKEYLMENKKEDLNLFRNEIIYIKKALERSKYNKREAAKLLCITPESLRRKIKIYDIEC
jgi:transcriptional regulator with PAS, ATPase and Fis domain